MVIDVHTHLFNLKYVPVREVVKARIAEWNWSPESAAALSSAVEVLAWGLTRESSLGESKLFVEQLPGISRDADLIEKLPKENTPEAKESNTEALFEERLNTNRIQVLLTSEQIRLVKAVANSQTNSANFAAAVGPLTPGEVVHAFAKLGIMSESPPSTSPATEPSKNYYNLITIMASQELGILLGLHRTYPQVSLFVHHMMDLEATYGETPYFNFEDQIGRMLNLQNQSQGLVLTFGAFDPFRRTNAFELATNEYARGVVGFKFYPPDGYKPTNNAPFPLTNWPGTVLSQWTARYHGISPSDIDRWNERFFAFCESNDVPILVHCSSGGGFEAVPGYGTNMANPTFWGPVLTNHPKLRLCFAHSGGSAFWFGQTDDIVGVEFGKEVARLCSQFDNVYCDSAYWDELLHTNGVSELESGLPNALRQYPRLAKKLMYGTDWFLLSQEDGYETYLCRTIEAVNHPKGTRLPNWDQFITDFFAGNAARYLRLDALVKDPRLSTAQRQLAALVHHLPPGWNAN